MNKNEEKDAGDGNDRQTGTCTWGEGRDGQTLTCTQDEGRDGRTVPGTQDEGRDGQTAICTQDEGRDGQTVTCTQDEGRDGRTVPGTQDESRDGQTAICTQDEGRDGQTVTCTQDEGRDGWTVPGTQDEGRDGRTVTGIQDEGSDGQTAICTQDEGRDRQTVTCTDDGQSVSSIDGEDKTVECVNNEGKDGQTVTNVENDENSRAAVKSLNHDKNGQVVRTEADVKDGKTNENSIKKGKNIIERAKIALIENEKTDALFLYRKGIDLLLQGLRAEPLACGEKMKLKQDCAEYITIAEKLNKELDMLPMPEDQHVVDYVNALIETERPNIKFDDVCGCEEVKQILKESFVLPSRFPHLFSGKRMPWKGHLLFGAPGTGKTMIARAVAGECPDLGFIHVNACDLISKYIGEPEKIIKFLFRKIEEKQPCMLVLDDIGCILYEDECSDRRAKTELLVQIQGIGQNRDRLYILLTTSEPWRIQGSIRKRIVRLLFDKAGKLKENNVLFIDDFDLLSDTESESYYQNIKRARIEVIVQFYKHENVRLLVASNQPWRIDCFHRKRLEKRIHVPMPDKEARKQLICKNLESIEHDMTDEDMDGFAEKLEGYTGSDIVCVVRDAMMEPVREVQKATHFCKVHKNPPDTPEESKVQYRVCEPDESDSIAMTFDVLEAGQLFMRPLCKDEMMKSLSRSKPCVDVEYLEKINTFIEEFA